MQSHDSWIPWRERGGRPNPQLAPHTSRFQLTSTGSSHRLRAIIANLLVTMESAYPAKPSTMLTVLKTFQFILAGAALGISAWWQSKFYYHILRETVETIVAVCTPIVP